MKILSLLALFLVIQLCFVGNAYCWGPAAHLYFGFEALSSLSLYGETVAAALSANPLVYFYGCVGADIVLAKKLGNKATHCHRWENAMELYDKAPTSRIQAFALGYLSHLAADTISHNCYVPSKTVEVFDSGVLKHLYWEMRFDQKVTTENTLRLFQEIVQTNFEDCDEHMEKLIPTRVLNFSWNKKIFNHLLIVQSMQQWQAMLQSMDKSQNKSLPSDEFEFFRDKANFAVVNFLQHLTHSTTYVHDPIGEIRLRQANELKRHFVAAKNTHPDEARELSKQVVAEFKQTPNKLIKIEDYRIKI